MIHITVEEADQRLRISVPKRSVLFKLILSLGAAFGCCVFGATAAASVGLLPSVEGKPVVVFWVNCSSTLVIIYGSVAIWMNRSILDIDKNRVLVCHGPLPGLWPRKRLILTSEIEQPFVLEIRNSFFGKPEWVVPTYEVWGLLKNGERVALLSVDATPWWLVNSNSAAENADTAKYIEERVERFLNIEGDASQNRVVDRVATASRIGTGP